MWPLVERTFTLPLVQTTGLPDKLNITEIDSNFNSWFYFYNGTYSPSQGALLVPNLGYQFDGSRTDPEYAGKFFKSKDCSSSISKWTGASEVFSTIDMEIAYNVTCLNYPKGDCDNDPLCPVVLEVLNPICNGVLQTNVSSGDIFTVRKPATGGGHTGFITLTETKCFYALSYARTMPEKEGLGFDWFCPTTTDHWFYFTPKDKAIDTNTEETRVVRLNELASDSEYLGPNCDQVG